jgi:hypothetical protein
MASPVYGTDIAGYMNILAGRARGMNEAERLRRMQRQQDYSNVFKQLGMQNQMERDELNRQTQHDWNVYNWKVNQNKLSQDYEWDVYDRIMREEQQDWQRRIQEEQLSRLTENDQWNRQIDLMKMMPRAQKQPSVSDAMKISAAKSKAYSPNATEEERIAARDQLRELERPVYEGALQVPSRKMSWMRSALETAKAGGLVSSLFGDTWLENLHSGRTGYAASDLAAEIEDLRKQITDIEDYAKQEKNYAKKTGRAFSMPENLRLIHADAKQRLENLLQMAEERQKELKEYVE